MTDTELLQAAKDAMQNAYAPYSGFSVGAALLTADGRVFTGCNIENASFSLTACAERTALFKAVSEGCRRFSAIAVVGGRNGKCDSFATPCGACRQALSEFCGEAFRVVLGADGGRMTVTTLGALLPGAFHLNQQEKNKGAG